MTNQFGITGLVTGNIHYGIIITNSTGMSEEREFDEPTLPQQYGDRDAPLVFRITELCG